MLQGELIPKEASWQFVVWPAVACTLSAIAADSCVGKAGHTGEDWIYTMGDLSAPCGEAARSHIIGGPPIESGAGRA